LKPITVLLMVLALSVLYGFRTVELPAQGIGNTSQTKENLDLPYDAIGENSEEEDAPEVVVFYGQNLEGDGIFYCIDRSGSMQNAGELQIAKQEVTRNIQEFSPNVEFGIVFFDAGVLKFPSSGQPMKAETSKKLSAISWVSGMAGGGGSAMDKGLFEALQFISRSSATRNVLVYVGDGGGSSNSLLAQIKGKNQKRAQINCVGVLELSPDNRQFLQKLARANSGTYTEIKR